MSVFMEKGGSENGKYILSESSRETIEEMNSRMGGLTLSDIQVLKGGYLKFPLFTGMNEMNQEIEAMDLSTRGYNSLKRNSISTVAELAERIECENDLLGLRNLGSKTAKEIMLSLLLYQFRSLPENRKDSYMERLMNVNGIVRMI